MTRRPEGGSLGDVFHDGVLDTAGRPNRLFVIALPFSPLDPPEQAAVVRKVREELLTACGLRPLAPADTAFRGRCRGNGAERALRTSGHRLALAARSLRPDSP